MNPNSPAGQLIHRVLGSDYIADCNPEQLGRIADAIAENPDGVQQLVATARTSSSISKPIPWLLSRIEKRAHLADEQRLHAHISKLQIAERRYRAFTAKHADQDEQTALDYALEIDGDHSFEQSLRRRLGLTPLAPIAELDERQRWARIQQLAVGKTPEHPLRLAVRETCSVQHDRTHDEALQVLAYLEAVAVDSGLSLTPPVELDPDDEPIVARP